CCLTCHGGTFPSIEPTMTQDIVDLRRHAGVAVPFDRFWQRSFTRYMDLALRGEVFDDSNQIPRGPAALADVMIRTPGNDSQQKVVAGCIQPILDSQVQVGAECGRIKIGKFLVPW